MMDAVDSVRYIILHCSATRCNCDYTVEQLLRDHRTRGFRTIGYHFYVRRDGTVSQHRRLLEVGAHCRPFNRCSIGVCYEGGLDAEGYPANTLTLEQFEQLEQLLSRLLKLFPKAELRGHRACREACRKRVPVSTANLCSEPFSEMFWRMHIGSCQVVHPCFEQGCGLFLYMRAIRSCQRRKVQLESDLLLLQCAVIGLVHIHIAFGVGQ